MNNRLRALFPLLLVIPFFLMISGCKKGENPTEVQVEAAATQDAAASISASLAINDGGALEQMSDMMASATKEGLQNEVVNSLFGFRNGSVNVEKVYDSLTGWWTVTVTRTKGDPNGLYHANYVRVYKHRFLNKNGVFQKHYIVDLNGTPDTAYSVNQEIVSGTGELVRPGVSRKLLTLSAGWTTTEANTSNVTVNTVPASPLRRAVSDTITRGNAVRTLNNNLTLNFTNVKGPRIRTLNWHRAISGTITGTYTATVTFLKGEVYREKVINREINITLGGDKIQMNVGGTKFLLDPVTGELTQ